MTLNDILHPVSVAEFLNGHFNLAPLHVPGAAGRFAAFSPSETADSAPRVNSLCRNLELDLEAPVQAEACDEGSGLPLQQGERDALVLQISGNELWQLHGNDAERASDEPCWEARLEDGGALYIPRGWWYKAPPRAAASRDLRLRIENPTGADLLLWLAEKLKSHPAFASDIPRFAGPAARSAYLVTMRHALVQAFRMTDLMERFARRLNARAPRHATLAAAGSEAESRGGLIVLAAPRRPEIRRRDAETIYITVGGESLDLPLDAAALLQFLLDEAPVATAAFYAQFEQEFEADELAEFLSVLRAAGVVAFSGAAAVL